MRENLVIPPTIKNHRYGDILGKIWWRVNAMDGIITIVFCGKRGKGKSYSMMEWGRLLDRGTDDKSRFVPEDVKVDPVSFLDGLIGKYPRGKVHVLDDAGLHLYKSDALSDVLKRVSKILQNIRYKHPIILMSLPHFGQLMKDARTMTDIYIEMVAVDTKKKLAIGKIQTLKISPFTGDLYRFNLLRTETIFNRELGIHIRRKAAKFFFFNKPPPDFVEAYENYKRPVLDKINDALVNGIRIKREKETAVKKPKMNFPQAIEHVKKYRAECVNDKGRYVTGKIMLLLDNEGKPLFPVSTANNLRETLSAMDDQPMHQAEHSVLGSARSIAQLKRRKQEREEAYS